MRLDTGFMVLDMEGIHWSVLQAKHQGYGMEYTIMEVELKGTSISRRGGAVYGGDTQTLWAEWPILVAY